MNRTIQYTTVPEAYDSLIAGKWTVDPQGDFITSLGDQLTYQHITFDTTNGPRFGTIVIHDDGDWDLVGASEKDAFLKEIIEHKNRS